MSWGEKLANIITGKSPTQRAYEKAATEQIKRKQQAEYFREKEDQSLRVAKEKARIEADSQIRRLRQRYAKSGQSNTFQNKQGYSSPIGGGMISMFGGFGGNAPTKSLRTRRIKKMKRIKVI